MSSVETKSRKITFMLSSLSFECRVLISDDLLCLKLCSIILTLIFQLDLLRELHSLSLHVKIFMCNKAEKVLMGVRFFVICLCFRLLLIHN